jgi:ABC-type uncharacterized transport system auxiliary subunit
MNILRRILRPAAALAASALLLGSCATTNRLDRYDLDNAALLASLRQPPAPTMDIDYSVWVDSSNPIGTALRVGTTILKASEAEKARATMLQALSSVDVPAIVLDETSQAFASALRARLVEQKGEYLLDLDIHQYGIQAPSWTSSVSLHLSLTAALYDERDRQIVWRRKNITVDVPASPQMFGAGGVVGDVVTAAVLSSLTVQQLEQGFRRLAFESAQAVIDRLERDLYRARYR